MKVILDIRDDKASLTMEMLRNFKYINEAKVITNYKADVFEGIKEAVEEVKLIKKGKLKGISAKELLNEL